MVFLKRLYLFIVILFTPSMLLRLAKSPSKYLKPIFLIFLFVNTVSSQLNAQICGTSGIDGPQNALPPINTYFPVGLNTTLTAGSKSLVLQAVPPNDPNYNLSYGVTQIKPGDLILIIQMQDATFNFNNSNLYGSGIANSGLDNLGGTGFTDIGSSGKYEYVVATSFVPLTGGLLTFRGAGAGQGAVNTYVNENFTATRGQRRFQVIRVPQYSTLVLSSNLTTPPYNGSVGGVIAFDVAGSMQFNGFSIDASERGFRGGYGPVAGSGNNTNSVYAVASSSTRSVGKGEGIGGTPRFMWDGFNQVDNLVEGLPGGSYGRGAPANAGGAGNDHNAGGGGGANGGHGGIGGRGWQGAGGNLNPLTGGGRPGHVLPVDLSRLIMGGGGGGGDANNATSGVKGGVGGGIILINVEKIEGFGLVRSNGGTGQAGAFGSAPDGAGGGGAGGSIFIRSLAPSATANLIIEAKGGNGGNTKNDNNNAHGPGGGGGGGFIYTQVPSATINTNIVKGLSGKSNNGSGINHGAEDGNDGISQNFTTGQLPTHLQGGGSICYPSLDVTLTELNAGPAGIRNAGTTATYILRVYNNVGGGNAGEVKVDFELPFGFSLTNVTQTLSGDAVNTGAFAFTPGSTGLINFGTYNISPGDYVEYTIGVNIASNLPTGIYHASAQATYLDPTRTNANPVRKITASNQAFTGNNTTYETGGLGGLPVTGTNYNGNLLVSSLEDVYINANVNPGDCDAIFDGAFDAAPIGEYDSPNYYLKKWSVVNNSDKVKIVNDGTLKGALIRDNGTEKFSLKQTVNGITELSSYTLTFDYRNWNGSSCSNAASKFQVEILDSATNNQIFLSNEFIAKSSPEIATINFTTFANTNSLIIKIYDPGSPNNACGAFIDNISITSPISVQLATQSVTCFGSNNGKLIISTLTGASGPYKLSYSSDGGTNYSSVINSGIITNSNPYQISNLLAGNYLLKIVDENNCVNITPFEITQPNSLTLSTTNTSILCYGAYSTVTLTAGGGVSPYTYSIDGVNFVTQNTFPDLPAGNYTFTVKDVNNCTRNTNVNIIGPSAITLSANLTSIKCFGETAQVNLIASGGTGTFSYSMDGTNFQASNIFTGVTPGPQVFTVKDGNDCMKTVLVEVIEPDTLTLSASKTDILCFGGTSTVTISATGGTGAYQFSKDGGVNFQSGNSFSGLTAGNYSFIVKDANDCSSTVNVVITEPTVLTLSASKTDILCFGGTSTVTLSATGGNGTYQFSKDGGVTFVSSNVFAGLAAGNYSFIVKDANNCLVTVPLSITEPSLLTLSASKTDILCFGGTSTVTLSATGGTGTYQFSKDGGNTFVSSNVFSGLAAGNYSFIVKDANNCSATVTVSIVEPVKINLSAIKTNINCKGGTAHVTLSVSGGNGPYQYSKDGISYQNENIFKDLFAGTYIFNVRDANNCIKSVEIVITEPAQFILSSSQTNILCKGGSAKVTLSATGGSGMYQYSKDGGKTYQNINIFDGLLAGSYSFTAKDMNNCTTSTNVVISEPTSLILTASKTLILCKSGTSELTLTAAGGAGTYQYSKDAGESFQSSNSFTGLIAGNYNFIVKDANNCQASVNVSITEPTALIVSENHSDILCFGLNNGKINLNISGGTAPYTYLWSNGSTNKDLENLPGGNYNVRVTDANNCVITKSIQIQSPTAPLSIKETHQNNICFGDVNGKINITVTGGTAPYSYSWSNGSKSKDLAGLPSGNYELTVTDKNNCSANIKVVINPLTKFSVSNQVKQISCFGEKDGKISLTLTGGEAPYTVKWSNGSTGNKIENLALGTYTYTAKDALGCQISGAVTITQPQPLTTKSIIKNSTCKFSPDGAIIIEVNGGTAPYKFLWNGFDRGQDNTLLNIAPGKYNVAVIDANNCSKQIIAEVLPGNCAPNASDDAYSTNEDTPITIQTPGIILNDLDPDDDNLLVSLSSAMDPDVKTGTLNNVHTSFRTKNGFVSLNQNGSFTYTPNRNFFGVENFVYKVTDGSLNSNLAIVTIRVNAVNDPPIARNDFYTTAEDVPVSGTVFPNDSDPDNDPLRYTLVVPPTIGSLVFQADGTFVYTPENNFHGVVTFSYQVCDPNGLCDQAVATITVTPVNDPPVAIDDLFYIQRNLQISATVAPNDKDPDNDPLIFSLITQPTNGTITFNVNGSFTYQPRSGFKGRDTFNYRICDPFGLCDEATVDLIIQPLVTVKLTPANGVINEGENIDITAELNESIFQDVVVDIQFSGSATNNIDYTLKGNFIQLTIPSGQTTTTQKFNIAALLDDIKDDNEHVLATISSTNSPTFVSIGTGSDVLIKDVYPERIPSLPSENPDINPDPQTSPNGDGNGNDSFIIYNINNYPDNEVIIFNRWGNEVYKTKKYNNKDNSFRGVANVGILSNTNKELVDGVYYYIIYTTVNGERKMNKGYLILKR